MKTRTSKILLNFSTMSDVALNLFADVVVSNMTDNDYFPDAAAMVLTVSNAAKEFSASLEKARLGGKVEIAIKNANKEILLPALKNLADYVTLTAGTNRAAFLSSGYTINSGTYNPQVLPATFAYTLANGKNTGELEVKVKKPASARSILFEYSLDEVISGSSLWQAASSSENNFTFSSLPVGKKVWVRITLIGTRKQFVTAPIVQSKVIQ